MAVEKRSSLSTGSGTSLHVSWSKATDNRAVTGYLLRVDGENWRSLPGRQATVTGLTPGTTYQMEVIARDVMGNWSQSLRARVGTARSFTDTPGHLFYNDILWMSGTNITRGCNPPANDMFCPEVPVTRAQAAAFLVRALGLSENEHAGFADVPANTTFADDIGKLATAGITRGCNPPDNDRFCPEDLLTRGQWAALLHRAWKTRGFGER